jgi:hypothetical protein
LIVENHVQQGTVDFDVTVVINKAQFPKFVHEMAHARSRRADHLRQNVFSAANIIALLLRASPARFSCRVILIYSPSKAPLVEACCPCAILAVLCASILILRPSRLGKPTMQV